ncbi:MAG: NAD(P)-binding domain-containing protein [Phycisphaerales bacterium]|nr:NAD(P)-binding domain-containing protein [Phycisphaerales bacterium]
MIDPAATIAIVGAGAMGTAIAKGAQAAGRSVTAVASRHPERAAGLAEELGAVLVGDAAEASDHADVIMLCVPDDAIAPVATTLRNVGNKLVVHTAGAKGLVVLDVAAGRGAHTGSLHPVMVVAAGGREHEALCGATVAIDGGDVARDWLTSFARDLHMEPVSIPAEHRALYHLSAAMVEQIERAGSMPPTWACFEQCDLSDNWTSPDRFDWIVVSGTLNTMEQPLAETILHTAWQSCDIGLTFNFLSDRPHPRWHDADLGPAHRFHLPAWYAWALERTPLVACRQDYLDGHDATILMRRRR